MPLDVGVTLLVPTGATEVCVGDEAQLVTVMQLGLAQRTVAGEP
jgi:hypothetical protein